MTHDRFHGRVKSTATACSHPGCFESGEFRAPPDAGRRANSDGPGDWQWLCLYHVRAFNARYNFFDGMSRDEIEEAQAPTAQWANTARVFTSAGVDAPPRWADFSDPLDAISTRYKDGIRRAQTSAHHLPAAEQRALNALGVDGDASKSKVRSAYSKLVRKYHPDRNGGDRRYEKQLQAVVEAYQLLSKSAHIK